MSIRLMGDVWERADCSQTALLVLLALADHANDDGICWPSVATIARKARTSERHTQRIFADLEADGWLQREARAGHSTLYRVVIPGGDAQVTPDLGVTPDAEDTQGVTSTSRRGDAQVTPGVTPRSPRTTREPPLESSSPTTSRSTALHHGKPYVMADVLAALGLDDLEQRAFVDSLKAHSPEALIRSLDRKGELADRIGKWLTDQRAAQSSWDRGPNVTDQRLRDQELCGDCATHWPCPKHQPNEGSPW